LAADVHARVVGELIGALLGTTHTQAALETLALDSLSDSVVSDCCGFICGVEFVTKPTLESISWTA
jgi:hypothetical protein